MKRRVSTPGGRWPRLVKVGGIVVRVYRRRRADGAFAFEVADYSAGHRRLRSFADSDKALSEAERIARLMAAGEAHAATVKGRDLAGYGRALELLRPHGVAIEVAAATLAECLKVVPNLSTLVAAARFYAERNRTVTARPVAEIVDELLAVKEARGASTRYLQDLRFRLGRFADAFRMDAARVTTAALQAWLDGQRLAPQSYTNFRRVLHGFFAFAMARGYAAENPVEGVEAVKVKGGRVELYTPAELGRLLAAAPVDFRPCIAIGAFAGLRSAEIERLEWGDVDLTGGHITIGRDKAKTASRRVVPICPALAAWLAPYAGRAGRVWPGLHDAFYEAQQTTAAAAGVSWKPNGLRHSFASYRFAELGDAGRVAGEMGNSPSVVHRHYRELVKHADAVRWFSLRPEVAVNVVSFPAVAG